RGSRAAAAADAGRAAIRPPRRNSFRLAEPVEARLVFQLLQPREQSRRAALTQGTARQPGEFVPQFARLHQPALDMLFEAAPIGKRDADRATHRTMPALDLRHDAHAPCQRADLRVGERALIVALGVARLAVKRERDAERDRILR